jgi:DHA1 family bicyclomycin/chloramphenicol resistance-like MFS transporter
MIFTVVPMLAPMLGSLIVAAFGWRASFGVVAIFGVINILAIGTALYETHRPGAKKQLLIQLRDSLREFVSHRQSLFGTSLVVLSAVGYMSMISGSAALILSIYGYPVEYFGIIFALQGAGLLLGSSLNRRLLIRFSSIQMLGVGAVLTLVASLNALAIVWLGEADFWWAWGSSCVFMLGSAFIMTNGTSLALDPVPRSAGVGSSIVGTIQGLCSAMSALIAGAIYDGTVARSVVILGIAGVAIAALYFSRRLLLGGQPLYGQEG